MRAALAAVHHEQALGVEAAALHQLLYAQRQFAIFQRLELVEQRRDEGGEDHHQQQVEHHPDAPGPQPPQAAGLLHQPQEQGGQRQADDGGHHGALDDVTQPQADGALVETETFLQPEGLEPAEG